MKNKYLKTFGHLEVAQNKIEHACVSVIKKYKPCFTLQTNEMSWIFNV